MKQSRSIAPFILLAFLALGAALPAGGEAQAAASSSAAPSAQAAPAPTATPAARIEPADAVDAPAASTAPAAASAVPSGRWDGWLDFGQGKAPFSLRLLPGGGGLLDLPGQRLYGYPLASIRVEGASVAFLVGGGEGALLFTGSLAAAAQAAAPARSTAPAPEAAAAPAYGAAAAAPAGSEGTRAAGDAVAEAAPDGRPRISGRLSGQGAEGLFELALSPPEAAYGAALEVAVRGGVLRGSLLLPEGEGPFPLVVLVAGAGETDRDGNNYNVPGRNDGLRALALALRGEGVASYRYDKRGAGESYALVASEAELSFDDYVADCAAVAAALGADGRFSRLVLAGHTEGGLVAAAAAARLGPAVPGLALLCPSGKSAAESVEEALAEAPEELRPEAEAIMAALRRGETYPEPSPYFADFFRPSFQPYLASWFRYDLPKELSIYAGQLLLVQGNRDFQVSLAEFSVLAALEPDAAAVVLPGMNHVLKEVGPDLEENYRSFGDPGFPLAEGLGALLAAFARGEAPDEGLLRVDGGVLPSLPGAGEAGAEGQGAGEEGGE